MIGFIHLDEIHHEIFVFRNAEGVFPIFVGEIQIGMDGMLTGYPRLGPWEKALKKSCPTEFGRLSYISKVWKNGWAVKVLFNIIYIYAFVKYVT